MSDKLKKFWCDQESFMFLLQEKRNFPKYPVDITSKIGQKLIKDIGHDSQHETFEAIQKLRNSKSHRATEISDFELDEFVEEIADATKYLLEMLILAGVSYEQFVEIFEMKTLKNTRRINEGY